MIVMSTFLSGIAVLSFAASGLFFLKFWKASRDPFFLLFALACELVAFERLTGTIFFALYGPASEPDSRFWIYIIRLLAFVLILIAVIQRNRGSKIPKS